MQLKCVEATLPVSLTRPLCLLLAALVDRPRSLGGRSVLNVSSSSSKCGQVAVICARSFKYTEYRVLNTNEARMCVSAWCCKYRKNWTVCYLQS